MEKNSNEINIWESQGKDSFVKCTTDWFSNQYPSRVHFSFVKHSGRDNGCKQLAHIEIGVPMLKAGSDGQGDTGLTALQLASFIRSGRMRRRADEARKAESKYPPDIFTCIGGTPSRRSKDAGAEFRRFSIAPSTSAGQYVFKAARCEGEDSGTGGVQPKKNAHWETIMVRVSEASLTTLAEYILSEWNAFRTAGYLSNALGMEKPDANKSADAGKTADAKKNAAQNAAGKDDKKSAPKQAEPTSLTHVYVVMDNINGVHGVALSAASAVSLARATIKLLKKSGYRVCDDAAAQKVAQSIMEESKNPQNEWYNFALQNGDSQAYVGAQVIRKVAP